MIKINEIVTKEGLKRKTEEIEEIQEEIRQFTPIIREDLEHLPEAEFIKKVCNNHIEYKIGQAKEGNFLYQCSFYNRKYFDAKNRRLLSQGKDCGKTPRELPGIDVNVAGLSKFIIDCPHAGEFMCKLRDFTFEQNKDKDIKNL